MNAVEQYFDKIFCINLDRSADRWAHVQMEAQRFGFTKIERFRGYDFHEWDHFEPRLRVQMSTGMCGCSNSHSGVLHLVAHYGIEKTLVLEDDFEILHDNFLERFEETIRYVPDDWDIIYLGAGYGHVPTERINQHVVRAGYIKTTSSYAIRLKHARLMAPILAQSQGPDDILSGFNPHVKAYVLHPRLMGQYECMSNIWGNVTWNSQSMSDPHHDEAVERLAHDKITPVAKLTARPVSKMPASPYAEVFGNVPKVVPVAPVITPPPLIVEPPRKTSSFLKRVFGRKKSRK